MSEFTCLYMESVVNSKLSKYTIWSLKDECVG